MFGIASEISLGVEAWNAYSKWASNAWRDPLPWPKRGTFGMASSLCLSRALKDCRNLLLMISTLSSVVDFKSHLDSQTSVDEACLDVDQGPA